MKLSGLILKAPESIRILNEAAEAWKQKPKRLADANLPQSSLGWIIGLCPRSCSLTNCSNPLPTFLDVYVYVCWCSPLSKPLCRLAFGYTLTAFFFFKREKKKEEKIIDQLQML